MSKRQEDRPYVIRVEETPANNGRVDLIFRTTCGDFEAIAHRSPNACSAVLMLGGSSDALNGPASLFPQLAEDLRHAGIASIRLSYRMPGVCAKAAVDALLALQYLDDEGIDEVALVGWSFGGAVALATAAISPRVWGVAAVSTLDIADCCVRRIAGRQVLFAHGEQDSVSDVAVARRLYEASGEPKRLITYPGAGHRLTAATGQVRNDLRKWLTQLLLGERLAA